MSEEMTEAALESLLLGGHPSTVLTCAYERVRAPMYTHAHAHAHTHTRTHPPAPPPHPNTQIQLRTQVPRLAELASPQYHLEQLSLAATDTRISPPAQTSPQADGSEAAAPADMSNSRLHALPPVLIIHGNMLTCTCSSRE